MHHIGGSGVRKNSLRCAGVRQRGTAASECDTNSWVFAKISFQGGLNVQGHVSADHRIISLALYNFARKRGVAYLR
jgi:hypothetical protein